MKTKMQLIGVSLALVLVAAAMTVLVSAQNSSVEHDNKSWKKGMLRLPKSAWAGDIRLKSGMYHVRHVVDGNKHVVVFKSVMMPAGKGFPMWEEKEVVRLECRVEPAMKSISNTQMVLSNNAAGEPVIQEIQIAGEIVRHILLPDTRVSR